MEQLRQKCSENKLKQKFRGRGNPFRLRKEKKA